MQRALLLLAAVLAASCAGKGLSPAQVEKIQRRAQAIFPPLPAEVPNPENPLTPAKIELGRALYYDARLSGGRDLSCNSCHALARHGVDGKATSPGPRGARNAPSVYNAALQLAQFWDGRARDVEAQAREHLLAPNAMAMPSEAAVEAVLDSIPAYRAAFASAFQDDGDPIRFGRVAMAIGAFERRLTTPSRFDAFLRGEEEALTSLEVEGLREFMDVGCITCHIGPGIGGSMYRKLGQVKPFPTADSGRYQVTKEESDRQVFKVPSLRNVAKTGPWFHDGAVASLAEAIRLMGEHQLGQRFAPEQIGRIEAFLGSLTGEVDASYTARPALPESSASSPPPKPS